MKKEILETLGKAYQLRKFIFKISEFVFFFFLWTEFLFFALFPKLQMDAFSLRIIPFKFNNIGRLILYTSVFNIQEKYGQVMVFVELLKIDLSYTICQLFGQINEYYEKMVRYSLFEGDNKRWTNIIHFQCQQLQMYSKCFRQIFNSLSFLKIWLQNV